MWSRQFVLQTVSFIHCLFITPLHTACWFYNSFSRKENLSGVVYELDTYINMDIAINARVFWIQDFIIFFLIHDRQRKMSCVKRNLFWKLIKKRLRSNWKVCLFHQQGLCLLLLLWLLIKQVLTKWLFIQTMDISQCGIIFLNQLAIRPKIMSSGLLLLNFCLRIFPLDNFTFIILVTLSKYWHVNYHCFEFSGF